MTLRIVLLAGAVCMAVAACDKDPARSMKIAASPPVASVESAASPPNVSAGVTSAEPAIPATRDQAPTQFTANPAGAATVGTKAPVEKRAAVASVRAEWRPEGCPPLPEEGSGPSSLGVTGPCAFKHQGKFTCEALADDFYISMTRKAAKGSTLMVYINVEGYKGPGDYKAAQMWVGVQDRKNIHRWSSDAVAITVGPDQAYAVLPTIRLAAEPLLVDCTGPMTNYQCAGRGESEVFLATSEIAAGTLQCEAGAKAR